MPYINSLGPPDRTAVVLQFTRQPRSDMSALGQKADLTRSSSECPLRAIADVPADS